MPIIRRFFNGVFMQEAPYFDELLATAGGVLPRDPAAHALWHYFMIAAKGLHDEKENLVYEDENSRKFHAENVFDSVAVAHGVSPETMGNYWKVVEAQRRLLGLSTNADIPERFKFRTKGH